MIEVKDHFMKKRLMKKRDMTYIIGAKCVNGVAIVADRKIMIENGTDHFYDKKIFQPYQGLIYGAAGTTGLFTSFHTRLIRSLENMRTESIPEGMDVGIELKLKTEKIIHEMRRDYSLDVLADELEILMASRTTPIPELICYNGYGLGEPVTSYRAIGHGEPYGSILLKNLWDNGIPLDMHEFSRLACIVIKYIQSEQLDNSVGVDTKEISDHKFPQVYHMYNVPESYTEVNAGEVYMKFPIRELSDNEVSKLMEGSDEYLKKIRDAMHDIKL